jgi:hypothetical protein
LPAPSAPTSLTASATGLVHAIALSWTAAATATSYNVYRGLTTGSETLLTSGVVGTSYTDNGLTTGQAYFYKVTAVNSGGESPQSNEATATATNVLIHDAFTDTNGVNLSAHVAAPINDPGNSWVALGGSLTIQGNSATGTTSVAKYSIDSLHGDCSAAVTVNLPVSGNESSGLYVRATDANNGWLVVFENDGSGDSVNIYSNVANVITQVAGHVATFTGSHTITAGLSSSTITAYVDGALQVSYGSATFNQAVTKHGLWSSFGGAGNYANCKFNDFTVLL